MLAPTPTKIQTAIALIFAPLLGCIIGLFVLLSSDPGSNFGEEVGGIIWVAGTVWLWSLPLSIPLGLVVHLALKKIGYQTHFAYTALGLALGFPALWLFLFVLSGGNMSDVTTNLWLGGITGGATALIFRLIIGLAGPASPPSPNDESAPY